MSELAGQLTMFDNGENYQAFVDKFKPKKTTDDCYTPQNVYEAVADWVTREYGVARVDMVRPFWPGGDYQAFDYPPGCCVVDNPPFSLLAGIMRFYAARGVRFFLFAPTLTLFSGRGVDVTYLPCGITITYENGAKVNTSFVTNLDTCLLRTVPDLYRSVRAENDKNEKAMTRQLPKYSYPPHVLTAAAAYQLSHYGQALRIERSEAMFIRHLDAMKAEGKGREIFGGGVFAERPCRLPKGRRRGEGRRGEGRRGEGRRGSHRHDLGALGPGAGRRGQTGSGVM